MTNDAFVDAPFIGLVVEIREGGPMYLPEGYSTQRVASAMMATLGSKLQSIPTVDYPRWTSEGRVTPPQLGDSSSQMGESCELIQMFSRDLRDRCDRGAGRRVIGASLQHAQLVKLHSNYETIHFQVLEVGYVVGKEYPGDNASNDPSLQPRCPRSKLPTRFDDHRFRAGR